MIPAPAGDGAMRRVQVIARYPDADISGLAEALCREGYDCRLQVGLEETAAEARQADVCLIELDDRREDHRLLLGLKGAGIPVIALVGPLTLGAVSQLPEIADFVLRPFPARETSARVISASGRRVAKTYKSPPSCGASSE